MSLIDDAYPRDLVMTAAIFGVAAFVWSGWAQEGPPRPVVWRVVLAGLGVIGLVVAGFAIPLVVRHWSDGTAMRFQGTAWVAYLIVVAIEVVACVALVVWVTLARRSDLIAPLILAVVGIHFAPLAFVFGQPIMAWAGAALTVIAVVAALLPASDIARSFWCGLLGAPVLLLAAIPCLLVGRAALAS
ncbi:hypothetical protein PFZ49_13810 [Microbacterium lacticum]|uniref:DUF6609 family protein n=1 Tax=Microbacterium lacticum TaxID=33885 RepID=UPI003A8C4165